MKNTVFWGAVLSGVLAASPVMAEDASSPFHALSQMPSGLTAMPEAQLASIEGGTNTNSCVPSASAAGAILPINLGNCSNVAVVVPVNLCVAVVGACAGAQTNDVDLFQAVQVIGTFKKL